MAKRSRISSRPGQRRPTIRRPASRPASSATSPAAEAALEPSAVSRGLTTDEEARAAELESRLVAQERAAGESARRARERARLSREETSAVPLSIRHAAEYAYVRRDLRRIAVISVICFGLLFGLYFAIEVLGLFTF